MNSSKKSASRTSRKKAVKKTALKKKTAPRLTAKKASPTRPSVPKKKPLSGNSAYAVTAKPETIRKGTEQMARLLEIMARLRRPKDGCPWDLEQNIDSIKSHLIEEAYEALDAMESGNRDHLAEELGDVLLQVVFQSQIAAEEKSFSFADVARGISDKLIRRHPHIFGDVKVADSKEVLRNWDAIKKTEKKTRESVLDGVPKRVPPLHRAYQIQKRAARVGFDWSDIQDVYLKLDEEIAEFKEAIAKGERKQILEELGDILFSVVNLARFVKVDPAYAIGCTNAKFERRFRIVENEIVASGRKMKDCTLAQMDEIWDRLRAEDKR